MNQRLDFLDFLKGFSIFTIVVMHLIQRYPISDILMKASAFGGAGVHVFILCSGFGLYLSHLNKPLSYPQFLKRRFLKVYLPYIIVIIVSALIPFYNSSPEKWLQALSHVFLFKMFVNEWECSFGEQMWFVSTIFQFYLCWPIISCVFSKKNGLIISLIISLLWATTLGWMGLFDERVWNSFFLQYLWEFVLGMHLAMYYVHNPTKFRIPSFKILISVCLVGTALTGTAGVVGGIWKLYNDIPSLFGYLSALLILYKLSILLVNRVFVFTSQISYEWYLVHILVFGCCSVLLKDLSIPILLEATIALIASYFIAYCYKNILRKMK